MENSTLSHQLYKRLVDLNDRLIGLDKPHIGPRMLDVILEDEKLTIETKKILNQLYYQSIEDDFFWQFCSLKVYKSHFERRLKSFIRLYPDSTVLDFIDLEFKVLDGYYYLEDNLYDIQEINNSSENPYYRLRYFEFVPDNMYIFLNDKEILNYDFSDKRKYEYLNTIKTKAEKGLDETTKVAEYMDYSDNTIAERITFLYELGILDFLKKNEPFKSNTNKLAELLSTFTKIKQKTIQSYINPIYNPYADQSKSALSQGNINTVNKKLIQIGYNKN